jgi:UDP-N-acetyl-D-galactosamine dehydrogenase
VILAGRHINDGVGRRVARECIRMLMRRGGAAPAVTVLGLAFKENVPDIRNSRVVDIVRELASFGIAALVHDPLAIAGEAEHEYAIKLVEMPALRRADAVILAVGHDDYVRGGWSMIEKLLKPGGGVVLDVKGMLDRAAKPSGIALWRL